MEAGPKLDRRIAEDVMKWTIQKAGGIDWYGDVDSNYYEPSEWSPSTNIAQAFEVVYHINKKMNKPIFFKQFPDLRFEAKFGIAGEPVYGNTAQHAICLAALKLIETK